MDFQAYLKNIEKVVQLLAEGGDQRLEINSTGRNRYGICVLPETGNYISLSSSTGSSISGESFLYLLHYYSELVKRLSSTESPEIDEAYPEEMQAVRDELRSLLGLKNEHDIVLGPSGTDLEMIPNYIGLLQNKQVVNIMSVPSETGSGTYKAATFSDFSSIYPDGSQELGACASSDCISAVPLEASSDSEVYDELLKLLKQCSAKNALPILRVIWGSKLGRRFPSLEVVKKALEKFPGTVVVVDCCQGRLSPKRLRSFLSEGWIVNFTGSKFYSGPPFCGCLIFPSQFKEVFFQQATNPADFKVLDACFTRYDFPKKWVAFDALHQSGMAANPGLLLRWRAAIHEMRRFLATDTERVKNVVDTYLRVVSEKFSNGECSVCDEFFYQDHFSTLDDVLAASIIPILLPTKLNQEDSVQLYEYIQDKYRSNNFSIGQPAFEQDDEGCIKRIFLRIGIGSRNIVEKSGLLENSLEENVRAEVDLVASALSEAVNHFRPD